MSYLIPHWGSTERYNWDIPRSQSICQQDRFTLKDNITGEVFVSDTWSFGWPYWRRINNPEIEDQLSIKGWDLV